MIDRETREPIEDYAGMIALAAIPFAVSSAIATLLGLMFFNAEIYGYGGLFVAGVSVRIFATAAIVAFVALKVKAWAE